MDGGNPKNDHHIDFQRLHYRRPGESLVVGVRAGMGAPDLGDGELWVVPVAPGTLKVPQIATQSLPAAPTRVHVNCGQPVSTGKAPSGKFYVMCARHGAIRSLAEVTTI